MKYRLEVSTRKGELVMKIETSDKELLLNLLTLFVEKEAEP